MSDSGITAEELRALRTKTVTGSIWASVGSFARQLLTLVFSVWLTRLLLPSEFGLVGMVMVVTVFARAVMEMGLAPAIIREPELSRPFYNTAFSLQLLMGFCLGALIILCAPLIAHFYAEPRLLVLARLLSIDLFLVSGYSILRARLRRDLRFLTITWVSVAATAIGGLVGIVSAWSGLGVYSLVAMMLSEQVMMLIGFWIMTPERPIPVLNLDAARRLIRFGSPLTVSLIVRRFVYFTDNLLIGKFFGDQELGLYSRSFTLMLMPVKQISGVLIQVLLPAFSRVQRDHAMFRDGFLRANALIALITFPMMAGMAVTAEHFVLGIFGPAWHELIPVLRIMCWAGALLSVTNNVWIIFTSTGNTRQGMNWGLLFNGIMLLGFVVGILSGSLIRFAITYTVLQLVLHVPEFKVAGRLIGLRYRDVAASVSGIALCCLGMASVVWVVDRFIPGHWPHLAVIGLEVAVGVISYWIMLYVGRVKPYRELLELLHDQWQLLRKKAVVSVRE